MSTAWYKPNELPKLLRAFSRRNKRVDDAIFHSTSPSPSIEIWTTTCIVTNFGKRNESDCSILVNSSNPNLLGVRHFPYFPKGGPVPKEFPKKDAHHIMAYVSQWGGMELKDGMLFPFNVIDGLVHQLGGWRLALHCYMLPSNDRDEKCPIGKAVSTPPGGSQLKQEYDTIVHTVPPFYKHSHVDHPGVPPEHLLAECYRSALSLSSERKFADGRQRLRIACPLLGAGGRGFPIETAIQVAAAESIRWRDKDNSNSDGNTHDQPNVLAFGIPQIIVAEKLIHAIHTLDKAGRE